MMDKYQALLIEWCDALADRQITDQGNEYFGGFSCESCHFPHGRADNAIYPMVCAYALTGNEKYLFVVEGLLDFRRTLTEPSGAMKNDYTSGWQGITAFSAIGLLKTLLYFGKILPAYLKERIEECALSAAHWVQEEMRIGFPAYINYYAAASLANALLAEYLHDDECTARGKELLHYCLTLFTENGLLAGEGKPHDDRSPKGCLPIDIGYIAEESMPCLIHAAALLGEEDALATLTDHTRKLLSFLLPDGGWDNSFGVRNNKWTYYGSRTSDGCVGAFASLAKRDPLFREAAERTYEILRRCTVEGVLYGGPMYYENGQKPCIHHTFCHAAALADAIHEGISEPKERMLLPAESGEIRCDYYPELDTYKIRVGRYTATLTGYDYATHHFANGAAHAGGGTLSLLYKMGTGAMIAGSVYDYLPTEPNNMQLPTGEKRHATLLLRAEYEKDGVKYATCLDPDPEIIVRGSEDSVTAEVRAKFCSAEGRKAEDESLVATFRYRFSDEGITITVEPQNAEIRLILPLIEGSGEVRTENEYARSPIFFLTGGFAANEYIFSLGERVTLTIV